MPEILGLVQPILDARGVTAEDLDAFGRGLVWHVAEDPDLTAGIDVWEDGELLVTRLASKLGIEPESS